MGQPCCVNFSAVQRLSSNAADVNALKDAAINAALDDALVLQQNEKRAI